MSAAVRILGRNGKVVGSGMVLDPNHILTCAHVLVEKDFPPPKQGDEVRIKLPGRKNKDGILAKLLPFQWLSKDGVLPASPNEIEDFVDFVVLRSPTQIAETPRFRNVGRFERKLEVNVSGVTADRPSGVNTKAVLEGYDDNERFQFNWPGEGNYPVDLGFSGSPLECDNWIVGMVVARFFPVGANKPPLSYGLPMNDVAEHIQQYLPEVQFKFSRPSTLS
jgi:Trypsin-like peptidase domain